MSNIKFSSRFSKLLKLIDNNVAKLLLDIEDKNIETTHNFIDLTDKKDTISFTPTIKANEILTSLPELWITDGSIRPLSHGPKNNNIYKDLGYTVPTDRGPWQPYEGTVGTFLGEAKSRISDNVYVIFKQYDENSDDTSMAVFNKSYFKKHEDYTKVWTTNRNTIKIGRLTRALLISSGATFTTKDIEDFTNQFKAIFDFNSDATNRFDIVSGKDIAKWYKSKKYVEGCGTMNNSCMANSKSKLFDIYVENPQVKLIILYDDNGKIENGKYTSNKIKGRALLWDATDENLGDIKFMDRIYVVNDSDFDLFKMFAELKGFWYKVKQGMDLNFKITNGVINQQARLTVNLDKNDFDFYPYLDSVAFLNLNNVSLTNSITDDECDNEDYDRKLRCTNGAFEDKYGNISDVYDDEEEIEDEPENIISNGIASVMAPLMSEDVIAEQERELNELDNLVEQLENTISNNAGNDILTRTTILGRLISSIQDIGAVNTTQNMIEEVNRIINEFNN